MWAKNKQPGFTIVELLIVIVVIGILAAITIVAYSGIQTRARDSFRSNDMGQIKKAIELYYVDNGFYPTVGTDGVGYYLPTLAAALVPKYIAKIPDDPVGGASYYQYVRGTAASVSYGIWMRYEAKAQCHIGTNNTPFWWGVGPC